ncbi:hypothetical protein Pla108_20140 [Botrimarina colliarenosi]|uniref:DUF7670 domain-containing protein n=1 Tax=Botrimarina colliarenosi TaxID=2528001 RepID=A0A5C6AEK9_9BACT|nr:hypothetical protein [Botrimarina colliarenosi]TWT97860.1 hypothetical protein Pla108_20140 [Botrimarina colliarenosi]
MVTESRGVLRWAARLLGLPPLLFVAAEVLSNGPPDLSAASPHEMGLLVCLATAFVGLAAIWRWELAGGLLTLTGMAAFYALHFAAVGDFPHGVSLPMLFGPGFLAVTSWSLARVDPTLRLLSGQER